MHIGDTVIAPNGTISRILVHDTWNTDIIPQLQPQPDDIIIYKNRFNGFYQTTLDSILQSLEIKYLIITGCTTSICVESTVRDAAFRNYLPIVLEDVQRSLLVMDYPEVIMKPLSCLLRLHLD